MSDSTRYITNESDLSDIADAIREKGATSALLVYPNGFVSAINAINTAASGVSYEIEPAQISVGWYVYNFNNTGLDWTTVNLNNSLVWIEFTENVSAKIWLDNNDDDDVAITIPQGTIAVAATIDNSHHATFVFFSSNGPYGFFVLWYSSASNDLSIAAYGDNTNGGCAVVSNGYQQSNGGLSLLAASSMILHITQFQ